MNKKKNIYKTVLTVAILPLLLAMCSKSSDIGPQLRTKVVLDGSTILADQAYTRFMFSTDGGATWSAAPPNLSVGKKYLAQVLDDNTGLYLTPDNFFTPDWSKSDPKPSDATSGTPEFTFADNNNLIVSVVDKHCTLDPASWVGVWFGTEVGPGVGGTDKNNITQDAGNPNKLIMDNYFGDHVSAYFIMSASTTAFDQFITMPTQDTSEGGTASGTGTYDQCRGTFTINTTYVLPGVGTFNWAYNFKK